VADLSFVRPHAAQLRSQPSRRGLLCAGLRHWFRAFLWSLHVDLQRDDSGYLRRLRTAGGSVYFALLLFVRWRQSALVGRAALFACDVGVGLFPLLGLWPIYMWRLPFALILFVIHVIILTVIICSVYFATRKVKATHAV